MRVLGLDIGTKRIGVAISDELGITAQPLVVLEVKTDVVGGLARICEENGVDTVVIGLPLSMNGQDRGTSASRARNIGQKLMDRLQANVVFWDERFSTAEAERVLVTGGVRRTKRKQVVDKIAAAIILQGYLDATKR